MEQHHKIVVPKFQTTFVFFRFSIDYESTQFNLNVIECIIIPMPLFCQVYKPSDDDGMSKGRAHRIHLQLWDTAGQERSESDQW